MSDRVTAKDILRCVIDWSSNVDACGGPANCAMGPVTIHLYDMIKEFQVQCAYDRIKVEVFDVLEVEDK